MKTKNIINGYFIARINHVTGLEKKIQGKFAHFVGRNPSNANKW